MRIRLTRYTCSRCDLSAIVIMDVYASRTVRKNTLLGQISVPLRSFFVAADSGTLAHPLVQDFF